MTLRPTTVFCHLQKYILSLSSDKSVIISQAPISNIHFG